MATSAHSAVPAPFAELAAQLHRHLGPCPAAPAAPGGMSEPQNVPTSGPLPTGSRPRSRGPEGALMTCKRPVEYITVLYRPPRN
jgi:hypothetical protein